MTNGEFKEFIDAGGYREPAHWQGLPFGANVAWQAAVARFVDATGRPGPRPGDRAHILTAPLTILSPA